MDKIIKNYCHIWNQPPRMCLIAKFRKKTQKCLNLGPKMSYLGILGQTFQKTIVISEISLPQICLIWEFCQKKEMSKFGTKNTLFGSFWARIFKIFCHIWNQHPRICLNTTFCKKAKKAKSKTKNALFGYFLARIWKKLLPYLRSALSSFSKMSL